MGFRRFIEEPLRACASIYSSATGRLSLGSYGERLAVRYLRRAGMTICGRNVRCPLGEIDIIAYDDEDIVFVEVKTRFRRPGGASIDPLVSVDVRKQRKLRQLARFYIAAMEPTNRGYRIDVIGVVLGPHYCSRPVIEHIHSAV